MFSDSRIARTAMFLLVAAGSISCDGSTNKKIPSDGTPNGADKPDGKSTPSDATGSNPTGTESTSPTPANGEVYAPLFVGRFDTTDPAGPKASWPGTRILTRFDGTSISVKFREHAEPWMEGAPSYWEVRIDKGAWVPMAMINDNQPHDFELAKDLTAGPHEVELYKRSETQTGTTQFLGFDLHGGKSLPPPPRQTRKIEVMGDSFATGFGVENIDSPDTDCPGVDWSGQWQNFRKTWGAVLGVTFDAEVHGIVYSAKGLLTNDWPTDTDPLKAYYNRADPNPAIQQNPPLFDLQSWIPDVIVMTQGSGDDGSETFKEAYRDFIVNTLRARGPNTHIYMGAISAGNRDAIQDISQRIVIERAVAGDNRMHAFMAPVFTWDEVTACNGHGTPAWHNRIAAQLEEMIRKDVGW